jgi:aminoglycoside phosphotransferase (APT) family kinase protein
MRGRHEGFATPSEAIFDLVRKTTGTQPLRRTKIVKGNANEVYRVETRQEQKFIVRVRHFGEVAFASEAWAMDRAREYGAPIPEVYGLEKVATPAGEREAMVMAEVEGQSLLDLASQLSKADLATVLREAGGVLRLIHSVKVDGFYRRHEDGRWDFADWPSLSASNMEGRRQDEAAVLSAGFSQQDFDFMIETVERYGEEFPCKQPVLVHGDYEPGNIFVDRELKISGVIDFGLFQGGPPIADFAHDVRLPHFDPLILKEGYGAHTEISDDDFGRQLNMYSVALQMGHLGHNVRIGNHESAREVATELRRTIAALTKKGSGRERA